MDVTEVNACSQEERRFGELEAECYSGFSLRWA